MSNPVCSVANIELPIVQAAMGGASCPALAAAVSNAGGLGMLALSWSSADDIRKEIRETRELTGRPFGVNLVLNWPQADRLAVCLEEGVPIISFFWGQAGPLIEIAHRGGAKVLHTIASADAARRAVDDGVDILVAQGWEAGGHVHGKVATMALVPTVVDRVPGTPVIAAGGIADGRGLAAAMALGASGAWIGTRFLANSGGRNSLALSGPSPGGQRDGHRIRHFCSMVGWRDAPHRTLRNDTLERVGKCWPP